MAVDVFVSSCIFDCKIQKNRIITRVVNNCMPKRTVNIAKLVFEIRTRNILCGKCKTNQTVMYFFSK